jgi:hypothetical protein
MEIPVIDKEGGFEKVHGRKKKRKKKRKNIYINK